MRDFVLLWHEVTHRQALGWERSFLSLMEIRWPSRAGFVYIDDTFTALNEEWYSRCIEGSRLHRTGTAEEYSGVWILFFRLLSQQHWARRI